MKRKRKKAYFNGRNIRACLDLGPHRRGLYIVFGLTLGREETPAAWCERDLDGDLIETLACDDLDIADSGVELERLDLPDGNVAGQGSRRRGLGHNGAGEDDREKATPKRLLFRPFPLHKERVCQHRQDGQSDDNRGDQRKGLCESQGFEELAFGPDHREHGKEADDRGEHSREHGAPLR